jgi:carboxymethylenebutenolidase
MRVVDSRVEVATPTGPMGLHVITPVVPTGSAMVFGGVVVFAEIYNVTAPVARFARRIAAHGTWVSRCRL